MRDDMGSQRNVIVVCFVFLFTNPAYGQALVILGGMTWVILEIPMEVAGICSALCDSLIPGTPEERG